jgi:DNA-binding MarR family transcriptional regulator
MTTNTSSYPLDPALEFLQRLWRLNHALERLSSSMDKRLGVTAQQRFVLRCIGKYPGLTAGQLAAILSVDPGTVSTGLKRLEAKGLVHRGRDPRDYRRAALGLSAAGRRLDRPLDGTVERAVERLIQRSSPEELATVAKALEALTALLGAEVGTTDDDR